MGRLGSPVLWLALGLWWGKGRSIAHYMAVRTPLNPPTPHNAKSPPLPPPRPQGAYGQQLVGEGGWHKALVVGSVSLWRRLLASRL